MSRNDIASPERLNERVEWGLDYYRKRVRELFKEYLPKTVGVEPVGDSMEEFATLTPMMPQLWAWVSDPNLPEPLRQAAQRDVMRWLELWRQYGQAPQNTEEERPQGGGGEPSLGGA